MIHLKKYRRSTAIRFRMKIGKLACYTNMNIYKQNQKASRNNANGKIPPPH